ncbi:MAG TPA: flagellar biosynthesis repressor FlbT [Acetobacteraceae bacterium]|nr:flagellar biosynthesis repressor FlbT [Acetobacteraceae bacterium]
MSSLVLHLRKGEELRATGLSIRFHTESRIELTARARFLFGRQIMSADQAYSPARKIYFALQLAYIATEEERPIALASVRQLVGTFDRPVLPDAVRELLHQALTAAEADEYYHAIKLARRAILLEEATGLVADYSR